MGRCTACSACKTSKQVVMGEGNIKASIVSIGEAPGPDEDVKGRPFIGPAGKLYDDFLKEVDIKREDIWTTNTVKCFPGRNNEKKIQKPDEQQIKTCTTEFLFDELKIIKPRVILVWGLTAAQALLKTTLSMGDLIGKELETEWGIVIPLYHPSYFLHNKSDFTARRKVVDALQRAKHLIGGTSGTYVDQVKVERHQEDKTVIAELEEKSGVFQRNPWNEKREYTTAWSDGSSVVLVYKNKHGEKAFENIDDFDWYFYMRTADVLELYDNEPGFWPRWKRTGTVHRLEADPINPEWTQVFAYRHVVRTAALREHLLESYLTLWGDKAELERKFKHDLPLRNLLDEIEASEDSKRNGRKSYMHYEADLTPARRFMTDYDIKIMSAYDEMYVDIETDDTKPLVDRKTISERRILSIAWETIYADKSKKPTTGFILLKKESNHAEAEMLEQFAYEMEQSADIMYAWNGNNFDFPILRKRMRMYRIQSRWDLVHTIDLLRTWLRYHQRGASANTSFSLQNIAQATLKVGKVDWKTRAAEQKIKDDHGKPITKILQLYRHAPHILEEYNRDDAHKLVELEKFSGYAKVDQVFSRIGNCFARDYHITTKIDSLLLKRGKQDGVHFRTKKVKIMTEGGKDAYKKRMYGHEGAIYEGAYVLDPQVGLYEDVAAMDFKSLYPSVMVAFNISPETWVRPEDVDKYDPQDLITCPTGAVFRQDVRGFVPGIFKDTGEKRKVYTKLQAAQPIGSDLFLLYYRLSYSFKRLGLSFYGDLGNIESRYFEPRVAEAVTKSGQWVLKRTKEFLEAEGITPLYGDTDSIYFQLPASEGQALADRVTAFLKKKMKADFGVPDERFVVELEYENYFKRMFFVRKKRYAGLMTMYKGQENQSFTEIKGFECMRSDGIEYARQMQRTVIEMILRQQSRPREIVQFLMDEREKALQGKHKVEDITITKAMTKAMDSYKSDLVHVAVAKKIRERGEEVYVGMKVPYIVTGNKPKLQAIPADEFEGSYDVMYYWDKLMLPPCYRIVNAVYPGVSWHMLFSSEKLQNKERAQKETNIRDRNAKANGHDGHHEGNGDDDGLEPESG